MTTLNDSLVSSAARRLAIRKRPDLSAKRQRYQGKTYWVVKEPVGLNYFRFQEQEFAVLEMLDGKSSLDDLKREFEKRFPPEKITVEELQQFIGTLHRSGLVVASVPGQGRELKKRRDERKRKELMATLTNILSIRFKGIDPDRLLTAMLPWFRWCFSPIGVAMAASLALSALLLISVQFEVFQSKLPEFHQFFTPRNAFWLAIVLAVTKVCHEFGHGLSCKYFGGECHELGVMVLVLTPCLYCNVSDSWMLPNKWHRAAIGAAGMYVEIVIASLATFVWWFSEPGLLHHLCLSTMFVSSVSTVLFNGNPLLRYDGYYILSDVMEIPNLRQKATDILNRKLMEWCLGIEQPHDPFLPERNQLLFAAYSIAAAVYRWVVVFSIMWFLYKVWEPYHLEIIGQMIGLASIYGLAVQPLWKAGKFFYVPGRLDKVKKPHLYATLAVVAALAAAFFFVPLPNHVYSTLEIQPLGALPVYVDVPGRMTELCVKPGQTVREGQPLARLTNLEAKRAVVELAGQLSQYDVELKSLTLLSYHDRKAAGEIPRVQENLKMVSEQLTKKQADLDLLELRAPATGTIMPPPEVPKPGDDDEQLPTWHGSTLDQHNLGASLDEGVLFCQVGDPTKMQAILIIDQSDIEFVQVGQKVRIVLESRPGEFLTGEITEIANENLKVASRQLTNKSGGDLATKTDEKGVERPVNTSYQARVPLDDPEQLLYLGLRGHGRIGAGYRTLGQQAWRYLIRTFHFDL